MERGTERNNKGTESNGNMKERQRLNGNARECMGMHGNAWECMGMHGNAREGCDADGTWQDGTHLQSECWLLLVSICKEWIPSSINWVFTHIWVPKPIHCGPYHSSLNYIQPYTVIWIAMRTNSTINPNLSNQAEKDQYQISSTTIWEHNILIYCILNAKLNIILLYWNKQLLESGIIKWGCCLLNENFHLILMFTCFWSM